MPTLSLLTPAPSLQNRVPRLLTPVPRLLTPVPRLLTPVPRRLPQSQTPAAVPGPASRRLPDGSCTPPSRRQPPAGSATPLRSPWVTSPASDSPCASPLPP